MYERECMRVCKRVCKRVQVSLCVRQMRQVVVVVVVVMHCFPFFPTFIHACRMKGTVSHRSPRDTH